VFPDDFPHYAHYRRGTVHPRAGRSHPKPTTCSPMPPADRATLRTSRPSVSFFND